MKLRNKSEAKLMSNPITESDLCRWIGNALPGDRIAYHRGFLCRDCAELANGKRVELARLAKRARDVADRGLAHLVQQRHGQDDYSYWLVARARHPEPMTDK